MQFEHMSLNELIHYAEIGEVPGLHPTVATRIRTLLDEGDELGGHEMSRQELIDKIDNLEETLDEISTLAQK